MSDDESDFNIFAEPAGYRPEDKPLFSSEIVKHGDLKIRCVTDHPLWGHLVYPSSKCMGQFLEANVNSLVKGKNVLELGAGAGLPGLTAAQLGAKMVVTSDYPDAPLIDNLAYNIELNGIPSSRMVAKGFTWGHSIQPLQDCLASGDTFDLLLLSDLVFNHSQHDQLLKSCEEALVNSDRSDTISTVRTPCALSFYAHHRTNPDLIAKDVGFAERARERGWTCEEVVTNTNAGAAFPEDKGVHRDLAIRSTVHGWLMYPPSSVYVPPEED